MKQKCKIISGESVFRNELCTELYDYYYNFGLVDKKINIKNFSKIDNFLLLLFIFNLGYIHFTIWSFVETLRILFMDIFFIFYTPLGIILLRNKIIKA